METQGKVLHTVGSTVCVEVKRQSACTGECKDCSGCEARPMVVTAISDIAVSAGDWVLLRSEQGSVLFGMFAVFILPLVLPLFTYLVFADSTLVWMFTVLAIAAAIALIWFLSKSKWFLARTTPRVIEILSEEKCK